MNFIAVDFETANRDPASVCSMGIAVVTNGVISERQQWLIKPYNCYFDSWNTKTHGISESTVCAAPFFNELWPSISSYIEGRVIVAHNASFEVNALRHTLKECNLKYPSFEAVCSLKVSRAVWPQLPDHQLSSLSALLSINHNHHDSLSDAEAAAKIILEAKNLLGAGTIREFVREYSVDTSNIKLTRDQDFWDEEGFDIHFKDEQITRQQSARKVVVESIDQMEKIGLINNYQVSLVHCECRDFTVRRLPCKHMYRLAIELGVFDPRNIKSHCDQTVLNKRKRGRDDYKVYGPPCIEISFNTEGALQQIMNDLCRKKETGELSEDKYNKKMEILRKFLET